MTITITTTVWFLLQHITFSDRSFTAAGPRAWIDLTQVPCDPGLSLHIH